MCPWEPPAFILGGLSQLIVRFGAYDILEINAVLSIKHCCKNCNKQVIQKRFPFRKMGTRSHLWLWHQYFSCMYVCMQEHYASWYMYVCTYVRACVCVCVCVLLLLLLFTSIYRPCMVYSPSLTRRNLGNSSCITLVCLYAGWSTG